MCVYTHIYCVWAYKIVTQNSKIKTSHFSLYCAAERNTNNADRPETSRFFIYKAGTQNTNSNVSLFVKIGKETKCLNANLLAMGGDSFRLDSIPCQGRSQCTQKVSQLTLFLSN